MGLGVVGVIPELVRPQAVTAFYLVKRKPEFDLEVMETGVTGKAKLCLCGMCSFILTSLQGII